VNLNYGTQINLDNQSRDFKEQLQVFFKSLSFEDLTGIYTIITHLSSVLLGIYAYHRKIDYDVALEYSRLEEHDNIKNWGLDLDVEKKHSLIAKDYKQAVAFLQDTLV
jgi:chaperone required for assembly of F1-ATPase